MAQFTDRTVIVTGAASGIGAAVVRRLYRDGATVIACDLSPEALAKLAGQHRAAVHAFPAAISDAARQALASPHALHLDRACKRA